LLLGGYIVMVPPIATLLSHEETQKGPVNKVVPSEFTKSYLM